MCVFFLNSWFYCLLPHTWNGKKVIIAHLVRNLLAHSHSLNVVDFWIAFTYDTQACKWLWSCRSTVFFSLSPNVCLLLLFRWVVIPFVCFSFFFGFQKGDLLDAQMKVDRLQRRRNKKNYTKWLGVRVSFCYYCGWLCSSILLLQIRL